VKSSPPLIRAVVPLLVVPSGLLWQVDDSSDGILQIPPRPVDHSTFFLNHAWPSPATALVGPFLYRLSHIEFATLNALPEVIESYFDESGYFS
jgi:hypothetical protein